MVEGKRRNKKK